MGMYAYKGFSKDGKETKGLVAADALPQAKIKLKQQGIILTSIEEETAKKKGNSGGGGGGWFSGKVKIEDLSLMTRQFATLIRAQIPMVEALRALSEQVDSERLRIILSEVKQKVQEGTSLSKALSDYPKVFNHVYINMVEAGEASGTLDLVLTRLADFTESQRKFKSKVTSAMSYPVIIAVIGFVMMNIIFVLVVPKISKIFVTMKRPLPIQTKICMWISDVTVNYWWLMVIIMFAIWFLFKSYISTPRGKSQWHLFLLKIPVISKLNLMVDVGRFCSTLSTLLQSSVPILTALRIVKNLMGNMHIQKVVDEAKEKVSQGKSMTGPLLESGHFPALVTHMIGLGENSGELEPMLKIVADSYEEQIDGQLSRITAVINPLMMLILGGGVFFVVLSVIMPIMELNQFRR